MKNVILLFMGLFVLAIIISCSSQRLGNNPEPKTEAAIINFEKPAPVTPSPIVVASAGISVPDTVYRHTETVREIMSAQVLSDWFEENIDMFYTPQPDNAQLIKLITDYQVSLNENKELISKYLDATKEKEQIKQAVQTQEKVLIDTPTIMFIILLIGQIAQSIKYRYSRKKEEKLIEELKSSRYGQ